MTWQILTGDALDTLRTLPDASVQMVCTSPPYYALRNYNHNGQIGLESTPQEYVSRLVAVFEEVKRVLRDDGTCWINIADSYVHTRVGAQGAGGQMATRSVSSARSIASATPNFGLRPKNLLGIPWRLAFALQDAGWWLRSEITWCKKAPMPESVTDRPTSATEKVFLLTKSARYFYDADSVRVRGAGREVFGNSRSNLKAINPDRNDSDRKNMEPQETRNLWNYWVLGPEPYDGAHFATMPTELVKPCILAGTSEKGCCPACLAPWIRKTAKLEYPDAGEYSGKSSGEDAQHPYRRMDRNKRARRQLIGDMGADNPFGGRETIGWEPSCSCPIAEPVPCTVLDPFCGSGTTGLVALRHNRNFIGVELNPDYVTLATNRIVNDAPLFNLEASA